MIKSEKIQNMEEDSMSKSKSASVYHVLQYFPDIFIYSLKAVEIQIFLCWTCSSCRMSWPTCCSAPTAPKTGGTLAPSAQGRPSAGTGTLESVHGKVSMEKTMENPWKNPWEIMGNHGQLLIRNIEVFLFSDRPK